jgi:hypothetical protein
MWRAIVTNEIKLTPVNKQFLSYQLKSITGCNGALVTNTLTQHVSANKDVAFASFFSGVFFPPFSFFQNFSKLRIL